MVYEEIKKKMYFFPSFMVTYLGSLCTTLTSSHICQFPNDFVLVKNNGFEISKNSSIFSKLKKVAETL